MSKPRNIIGEILSLILFGLILYAGYQGYKFYDRFVLENKILKEIVHRLQADSRIAEAIVVDVFTDANTGQELTTIKFLEYDAKGRPLTPKHFTFIGNIIQFQSLVVRFDDKFVREGDALRGKSAYVFWKVFYLDGVRTQEFEISPLNQIPEGYKIDGPATAFEQEFWTKFWNYALDPKLAKRAGVKNAQLEAPGSKFIPGMVYTLKIEHDGGIRIDAAPIPEILRGEKIK